MPRCYMVKKCTQRDAGPAPSSPVVAAVAPPCYSPDTVATTISKDLVAPKYAELSGRSEADTEAAHELLSLAHSLPPLPPATVISNGLEDHTNALTHTTVLPIYTYTIQPTNFYVVNEQSNNTYENVAQVPLQHETEPRPELYTAVQNNVPQNDLHQLKVESIESEVPKSIPTSVIQHTTSDKYRYECVECGKNYATSSNLTRHKQTHRSLDSKSARKCRECGKVYVSMPALAMHVLTHRMGHVCSVCNKQFSRPWLLRGHLRSHTGEKPYSCATCSKSFSDRSNLRAHLQTHSLQKKYECLHCHKNFALKSYLNKHMESACTKDDP